MIDDALTAAIINSAFRVHKTLGSGFLEKVYRSSLRVELEKRGYLVKENEPIKIHYDGVEVGEYYPDLLVENKIILELKAGLSLAKEHEVQLVNYLTATKLETGLLINFGTSVQVKRKYRDYKPPRTL